MTPRARALIEALAAELQIGRATGAASLPRAAVVLELDGDVGLSQATLLLEGGAVTIRQGRSVPPLCPACTVRGREAALADVLAGLTTFADVARTGALSVEGADALLAALAAHLVSGQSPLQVRLRR